MSIRWLYIAALFAVASSALAVPDLPPEPVPDGGATLLLFAGACAALGFVGRAIKRR